MLTLGKPKLYGTCHCKIFLLLQVNINDCSIGACANGGDCIDLVDGFECVCQQGWEGQRCDVPINYCISNPCQNDGLCIPVFGDFFCKYVRRVLFIS